MNDFCNFYLVRHGETDKNVAGLLQGHSNSTLTEKGKDQAHLVAKALNNVHFDAVFSSDLSRAKDTADIIAQEHNIVAETTKLLRERTWGHLEGQSKKKLEQFEEVYQKLSEDEKRKFRGYEDIETDEELTSRYITFIREVALAYPEKNILLVSHGGAIKTFLIHIGFWSYKKVLPTFPHTAYIKFRSNGIDFFVDEIKGFEGIIPRELKMSDR